jgi:hypothetical protein
MGVSSPSSSPAAAPSPQSLEADLALALRLADAADAASMSRFDAADLGEADDDALATRKVVSAVHHEAVSRDIGHVQGHVTTGQVLDDHRVVDRVPSGAALIVDRKLCSGHEREPPAVSDMGSLSQKMLHKR